MQEKIAAEWNRPEMIEISEETYQKLKDNEEAYKIAIERIKEILEELEDEIKK